MTNPSVVKGRMIARRAFLNRKIEKEYNKLYRLISELDQVNKQLGDKQ